MGLRPLAEMMGVSAVTVSKWERGERIPTETSFQKLGALMGRESGLIEDDWLRWAAVYAPARLDGRRRERIHVYTDQPQSELVCRFSALRPKRFFRATFYLTRGNGTVEAKRLQLCRKIDQDTATMIGERCETIILPRDQEVFVLTKAQEREAENEWKAKKEPSPKDAGR